jgi:iron(III) transport system ATP-binding protein
VIEVDALWKSFGDGAAAVLRGVSFHVKRGEIYTLLGPSGCGKTTSLRSIAGVETPDKGRITLGDRVVFSSSEGINLSPDRRRIGMVFQSYAIWPHMTVAGNVAYPIEAQRLARSEIDRRVARALQTVGLAELHDRPAPHLSGGQQQRVALARAIVAEPDVLLLDEPLSNLDAKLRGQMRQDLLVLQRQLGHTTVYVTHDQEEALALSHRIALMRGGEIVEEGDPISMYEHPRHPFSAAFLGAANFIPCTVQGRPRNGERIEVETPFGRCSALARPGDDSEARLFFRPHHAQIVAQDDREAPNQGRAQVTAVQFLGETLDITVRRGDVVVSLRSSPSRHPAIGQEVSFSVDPAFSIAFLPGLDAGGPTPS